VIAYRRPNRSRFPRLPQWRSRSSVAVRPAGPRWSAHPHRSRLSDSLRVRRVASSTVQIGVLTWSFMADPSTVVQDGPGPLLAEALAVSVCAAMPEPTHVAFVLSGSRALSPVDQQCPRFTGGLVQLDLERIGIPLDKPRESSPVLLDRHTTPNLIPPRLATRLRLIHDDHGTPVTRGQADPERRAGHGPSTGSRAAAIAPSRTAGGAVGDRLGCQATTLTTSMRTTPRSRPLRSQPWCVFRR
jgi:hypothetical protein